METDVSRVCCLLQVETEGLRRSIQNLGVLLTTAAVAHTSVATGEGLRHAATGQHHTITVTTKDKVPSSKLFSCIFQFKVHVFIFSLCSISRSQFFF